MIAMLCLGAWTQARNVVNTNARFFLNVQVSAGNNFLIFLMAHIAVMKFLIDV